MLSFRSTGTRQMLGAILLLGCEPSPTQTAGSASVVPADGGSDYNERS